MSRQEVLRQEMKRNGYLRGIKHAVRCADMIQQEVEMSNRQNSLVFGIGVFLLLMMVAATTTVSAAGERQPAGERALQIAYLPPNFEQADFYGQYFMGLTIGLEEQGIEYELVRRTPETHDNHAQQLAIVEDVLTIGVDYIVMAPTHYEGQQQAYRTINDAGVPLFIFNYSDPFPAEFGARAHSYIGYRHSDGGKTVADYLAAHYPQGTNVAIIYGTPTQISYDRGAKELHLANGMNVIFEHYANWQRDQAYDATQRLLTAHPNVDVIIGCSSFMAMGAVRAAADAGRLNDVDIFGAGAILEELDAIAAGELTGAWYRDPVRMGQETARYIKLHLDGRAAEIPESYNVPIVMIDSVEAIREHIAPVTYTSEGREKP